MTAFYQGNYLHNIPHKINFLWLMCDDYTLLIRYDRMISGRIRIMDFNRYDPGYCPIHQEGDFKEAAVSDVQEVVEELNRMVRQIQATAIEFSPTL